MIRDQFNNDDQMAFVVGPRQVGKTTTCKSLVDNCFYYNWDNQNHRKIILRGPDAIAEELALNILSDNKKCIILDEIHKYSKWKTFVKGLYDTYKDRVRIVITGSSRLDVFKKGGDSLMGRYFLYRMHPLSIAELSTHTIPEQEIRTPGYIGPEDFENLFTNGGFPEPFIKNNLRFTTRWKSLRKQQFFKEDIRDLTKVRELGQIEILADLIRLQSGQLTNYSNLANKINVSVDTVTRWIKILESLYYCFSIKPWSKNISRSLIKEPKLYLWDWSWIDNRGSRIENFVASHLLKAVHFWTDIGFGDYDLYFLRDKEKREVDFMVTKNNNPWFLVEVKSASNKSISKNLVYFYNQLNAPYAFQASFDMEYIDKDVFSVKGPVIVPLRTMLSQLI